MSIKAVLFDLDGTLLPMEQEIFAKAYIGGLVKTAATLGYDPKIMADAIMSGTYAMVKNDGRATNEKVFWEYLSSKVGEDILKHVDMFDEFYRTDFQRVSEVCGYSPRAAEIITLVKEKGFRVSLATNPLFPVAATESRIAWAGLEPGDFEFFTTFETSHYCKPNLDYYREVTEKMGVLPEECLMVGNDVGEDMIAEKLGMKTFLLTDCMINRNREDISVYPHGGFDELSEYISSL